MLAQRFGEGLQKCPHLYDVTVSTSDDPTLTQGLTFQDSHLQLESASEELVTILLQLHPELLQNVRCIHVLCIYVYLSITKLLMQRRFCTPYIGAFLSQGRKYALG